VVTRRDHETKPVEDDACDGGESRFEVLLGETGVYVRQAAIWHATLAPRRRRYMRLSLANRHGEYCKVMSTEDVLREPLAAGQTRAERQRKLRERCRGNQRSGRSRMRGGVHPDVLACAVSRIPAAAQAPGDRTARRTGATGSLRPRNLGLRSKGVGQAPADWYSAQIGHMIAGYSVEVRGEGSAAGRLGGVIRRGTEG